MKVQKAFETLYTMGFIVILKVLIPVWVLLCIVVGVTTWPMVEFFRFATVKSVTVAVWLGTVPAQVRAKVSAIRRAVTLGSAETASEPATPEPAPAG